MAILIVPASDKGRGGGHLSRCLFLMGSLAAQGREAYLWIPAERLAEVKERFASLFDSFDSINIDSINIDNCILRREEEFASKAWDFIIFDNFKTSPKDFVLFSALNAPLIGIDEGGSRRACFDFLIDLLPALSVSPPNLSAPHLLPLPENRRPIDKGDALPATPLRLLVSFGAEDSAGLGLKTAKTLSKQHGHQGPEALKITLISPRGNETSENLPNVEIIKTVPRLKERFAGYDLVITHFGLSAFEALYARCAVLLLSPTQYHRKLSKKAGFVTGSRFLSRVTNRAFVHNTRQRCAAIARRFGLEEDQKEDLGSFIAGIKPSGSRQCPVCGGACGSAPTQVIARCGETSFRRCPDCLVIYQIRLTPPPIEYERDYFFDFYKKQYGKTYLEDFPNLKEMGRRRLTHISELVAKNGSSRRPRLLDIGCAYGPFMAVASEAGFESEGVEPASDAARYVNEELGLLTWHGVFPDALGEAERRPGSFDVVTLWYVIEHFEKLKAMLAEIHRLLKDGGVLAFSSPSCSGISGRSSLRLFLQKNPADHFTIQSPRSCRKILRRCGFRLKKIVVTGHHPQRFPLVGKRAGRSKKGFLYRTLLFISRLFRLGDTFEAYAIKMD